MSIGAATSLCIGAARAVGANAETAEALARAVVDAEAVGQSALGMCQFADYLSALEGGRLVGCAEPVVHRNGCVVVADAQGGTPYVAFDRVFDEIAGIARGHGVAVLSEENAYVSGALGYFVERFGEVGLIALAAANSPARVSVGGSSRPVFGTNPLAFCAPTGQGPPLLIDQASSAVALAQVRWLADVGGELQPGQALDANGDATTDPTEAAMGSLLPFGGPKGGNIALVVEVLSVLSGANWSLDAPPFLEGGNRPGVGMFVAVLDPEFFGRGFTERLSGQMERLAGAYRMHVPGMKRLANRKRAAVEGLRIAEAVVQDIAAFMH